MVRDGQRQPSRVGGPGGLAVTCVVREHRTRMICSFLQAVQRVSGAFRTQILRFNVDIHHRLQPVAGDGGLGPVVVPVHVDAADAIVRRLRDRIPDQDNLAGDCVR